MQECLEVLQKCLNVQEYLLNQAREVADSVPNDEIKDEPMEAGSSQTQPDVSPSPELGDEIWVVVVKPVTPDALLDTLLAQVAALVDICSLESSGSESPLAWVEEYYQSMLSEKLSEYAASARRKSESDLMVAKFRTALANVAFRSRRIGYRTYAREVHEAYQAIDVSEKPQGLCDIAEAHLTFATKSLQQIAPCLTENTSGEELDSISKLFWTHATNALNSFTSATNLIPTSTNTGLSLSPAHSSSSHSLNLPRIHLHRGDLETFRLSLRDPPMRYALAANSSETLLGNAALYYRMAGRQAGASGAAAKEEAEEAYLKGLVVEMVGSSGEDGATRVLQGASDSTRQAVRGTLEEMREDGILGGFGYGRLIDMLG